MLIVLLSKTPYYILVVTVALLINGCDSRASIFEEKVDLLVLSHNSDIEKERVINLNDYAVDKQIPYSLNLKSRADSSGINIGMLEEVINEELSVVISTPDNGWQASWEPLDNNNIFILLRE